MPEAVISSKLITQGYGFPEFIITKGAYAPDPRCPLPEISPAHILKGFNSETPGDLVLRGLFPANAVKHPVISMDSFIQPVIELESFITDKDGVNHEFNMWI